MELNTLEERELYHALLETRREPGIPLARVAEMLWDVYSKDELESIARELAQKKYD